MAIEIDRPRIEHTPGFSLAGLPRQTLAILGREWLLHGHLQDRVGMPLALAGGAREEMEGIAIDEWMAASPIYSRRTQRAMNFAGDGVDTILKNIQFDIGAPHHFMDFRSTVHDHDHGEFLLAHCGALMDVEPMGEEFVRGMCHTIEDPTFDATAVASNPRVKIRPLHRPPRVPADRYPHCHWTVTIDEPPARRAHPNRALVQARRSRGAPSTTPARRASRAAGPTTRARSTPTSSSRTSRDARSSWRSRSSRCRATCSCGGSALPSRSARVRMPSSACCRRWRSASPGSRPSG